jgi:hypothetical protein
MGARGKTGAAGKKGATGARGTVGSTGSTATLTKADRMEMLSVIEGQIDDIHQELNIQMKQMAQMQAQLDDVRATVRRIIGGG